MKNIEKFVRLKLPWFFVEHHVKPVVKHAKWLCKFYPRADKEVVEISAWLHDIGHVFTGKKYILSSNKSHHIDSRKMAEEYLHPTKFPKQKMKNILHCIISHRTSRPPHPRTIEAKIVASADNLAHFTEYDYLLRKTGFEFTASKLKRDLKAEFMLPEALEKAREIFNNIKFEKKH